MHPVTTVGGEAGYIFGSDLPESYCFVPERCVSIDGAGRAQVDEKSYFLSGWSIRNMRWADSEPGGSHLFPDTRQLVSDFTLPAVQRFLDRVASRSRHPFARLTAN
ncbi:MAG TPA: hypothetical protein VG838_09970 [Opitutaceae bacterium]|nr:hypothetical protein [Opitutaceae bacterium]